MGTLFYGGAAEPVHIEDRLLAHLKVVISTKLRRNECFTLSWVHQEGDTPGRSTLWMHPAIPLRFVFDAREPAELRSDWIVALANSASSSGGISLLPELMSPPSE